MRNITTILAAISALLYIGCQQFEQPTKPNIDVAIIMDNPTTKDGAVCYDITMYFNLKISRHIKDNEINLVCKADDYDYSVPVTNLRGDDTNKLIGSVSIPIEAFNCRAERNPDILQTKGWTIHLFDDSGRRLSSIMLGIFEYYKIGIPDIEIADYHYTDSGVVYYVNIKTDANIDSSVKVIATSASNKIVGNFIQLQSNGALVSFTLAKSLFNIDYSRCTATTKEPFYISLAGGESAENTISDSVPISFIYDRQPRLDILSLNFIREESIYESDSDRNKKAYYDFEFLVDGALFMSDIYTYYIGNWSDTGKGQSVVKEIVDSRYTSGEWWVAYATSAGARTDYKQLRTTIGGREVISEHSIKFDFDTASNLKLSLVSSDGVTDSRATRSECGSTSSYGGKVE